MEFVIIQNCFKHYICIDKLIKGYFMLIRNDMIIDEGFFYKVFAIIVNSWPWMNLIYDFEKIVIKGNIFLTSALNNDVHVM